MLANSYCRDYLSASADPIIVMDLKLFKLFVHIIHKSLGCPKANSRLKKGGGKPQLAPFIMLLQKLIDERTCTCDESLMI